LDRRGSSRISITTISKSCTTSSVWSISTAIAGATLEVGWRRHIRPLPEEAIVTGVDLSFAITLARQNFAQQGLEADLREADNTYIPDNSFDLVRTRGRAVRGRRQAAIDDADVRGGSWHLPV
jgi:hypothetical protein